jgi:hypothetical protein
VTLERQETILVLNGTPAAIDCCPLCGRELAGKQTEEARLRLQKNLPAQENKL